MKKLILFASALALAGCSSVFPKGQPAATFYTLNAPQVDVKVTKSPLPVDLQILMPQAAPGLETERIALRKDNQIDYYKDMRWSGAVTSLVQSLLVQSFDQTHALFSVSNDLVAAKKDYSLLIDIQDFQTEYKTSQPTATIRMTAKLIRSKDNAIVSTFVCAERETAKADNAREIVAAFDNSYQRTASCIVSNTIDRLKDKK